MSIQYKILHTEKTAHDEEIWDVIWQDENTIITSSLDDQVKAWTFDPESGKIAHKNNLLNNTQQTPHNLGVNSIDYSKQLEVIVTRSLDSFIRSFNKDYELVKQLDCTPVNSWNIKFFPNGRFIATGSMTGHVHIINASNMEAIQLFDTKLKFVVGLAISDDGKLLACSGMDGKVVVFEISYLLENGMKENSAENNDENNMKIDDEEQQKNQTEQEIQANCTTISAKVKHDFEAHKHPIRCLCFDSTGQNLITGSDDKLIKIFNLEGATMTVLDTLCGHGGWILAIRKSPDNRHIVSSSADGKIKVWDMLNRECVNTFDSHSGQKCWAVAYSPDGSKIASVSSDKSLVVYDCPTINV